MKSTTSNDYFSQKIALLKQCLDLSEEFIGSIEDWQSLAGILVRRQEVIKKIQVLDETLDKTISDPCSQSQKSQINQLVKLILEIDGDVGNIIRREQENLSHSIKTNIQEQKMIHYSSLTEAQNGRLLYYKK